MNGQCDILCDPAQACAGRLSVGGCARQTTRVKRRVCLKQKPRCIKVGGDTEIGVPGARCQVPQDAQVCRCPGHQWLPCSTRISRWRYARRGRWAPVTPRHTKGHEGARRRARRGKSSRHFTPWRRCSETWQPSVPALEPTRATDGPRLRLYS